LPAPKPLFSFRSLRPDDTRAAALSLARSLPAGGVVLSLVGELGVGKTHFVKGLAEGLGFDSGTVTSPTFAIVNEYAGESSTRLVHMDFYRLESEIALEDVGFIDLLEMDAVLAIEWGDRFPRALPPDHIELRIERPAASFSERVESDSSRGEESADQSSTREFTATARGPRAEKIVRRWQFEYMNGATP
jgi:tRNA threonylcarbamoyladenosine biosynthesis protein TsaE